MKETLSLIKEKEREFEEKFRETSDYQFTDGEGYYQHKEQFKSHTRSTIISILESLREEIGGLNIKREPNLLDGESKRQKSWYNDGVKDSVDHLTTLITNLKE